MLDAQLAGANQIPLIHVRDWVSIVLKVASNMRPIAGDIAPNANESNSSASRCFVAKDFGQDTQLSIMVAISQLLGNGQVTQLDSVSSYRIESS